MDLKIERNDEGQIKKYVMEGTLVYLLIFLTLSLYRTVSGKPSYYLTAKKS